MKEELDEIIKEIDLLNKKVIVDTQIKNIVNQILKSKLNEIEVICNYSSLLQFRKILLGKNIL